MHTVNPPPPFGHHHQAAKVSQDEELRALKERMLSGAPLPGMAGSSGAAARNKMLIKGGSSFNALVRAMKQDLVESSAGPGAAARRDPNLLYEIDQLSLDRVVVKGDGEIGVQAMAARAPGASLGRPGTPPMGHTTMTVGAGSAGRSASAGRMRGGVKLAGDGYSSGSSVGMSGGGALGAGAGRMAGAAAVQGMAGGYLPGATGGMRASVGAPGTPGSRSAAGSRGGAAPGGASQKVVAALSGLSPQEVQRLQQALGA